MSIPTKCLRAVPKRVTGRVLASLVAVLAGGVLHARTVSVPPQPVSPYLDTEVSTNIAFGANYDVTREIVVNFSLDEGCSSNCLQVAFGRDAFSLGEGARWCVRQGYNHMSRRMFFL